MDIVAEQKQAWREMPDERADEWLEMIKATAPAIVPPWVHERLTRAAKRQGFDDLEHYMTGVAAKDRPPPTLFFQD